LIVADPREHEMARCADIDNGHAKLDFLDKWVNGLDEFRKSLEPFTMEYAAKTCDVPLETKERVAKELAAARSIAILWAMGNYPAHRRLGWIDGPLEPVVDHRQLHARRGRSVSAARP
jgi:hypothetical protein